MNGEYLVEEPFEPGSLRSFANIINLGHLLATGSGFPTSPSDDVVAIPHYRMELGEACKRAGMLFLNDPTIEDMLWHSLRINAVLIELCGAAPNAVKDCGLTMRAQILILLDESRKDRNIRG